MTFKQMAKNEVIPAGKAWISVTSGMSGFFAVMYWMNNKDEKPDVFAEPWDAGTGRYATIEEACAEALAWAEAEDLPYSLPITATARTEPIVHPEYPKCVATHIWEISEGVFDYTDETDNFSGTAYKTIVEAEAALGTYEDSLSSLFDSML